MANSIREILEKKKKECKSCQNRFNVLDLCKIAVKEEQNGQYLNLKRCMQNKCKTCKEKQKCERNK